MVVTVARVTETGLVETPSVTTATRWGDEDTGDLTHQRGGRGGESALH